MRYFGESIPAHECYLEMAVRYAARDSDVMHLGAGRDAQGIGRHLAACRVTAVDPDPRGLALNPAPRKVAASGESLPFPPESFDLILCEHVFEHLERPARVLSECARVLRPGGRLLFMTPNKWSYIALAATLTPHRFHVWYKSKMIKTAEVDTFPTRYRLNTRGDIERLGQEAGLRLVEFKSFVGCPTYLEIADWPHRLGCILHRVLEKLPEALHISFVGSLHKSDA